MSENPIGIRAGAALLAAAMTVAVVAAGGRTPPHARQGSSLAADWPQWRGPRRDGSVTAALPAEWPSTLSKRWEVVVGSGSGGSRRRTTRTLILLQGATGNDKAPGTGRGPGNARPGGEEVSS